MYTKESKQSAEKNAATTMDKIIWKLDPVHSEVAFQVKHMMITNVRGVLKNYTVEVTSDDEKFSNADIFFSGKTDSIDTGNTQRDEHLRSADFFDAEKKPEITFKSTGYKKVSDNSYKLEGDLTIKEITKKISLDVEFGGVQKDPQGNTKAGFSITGKINRKDFGLNWNTVLETGGMLVSDDVKIACEIQLTKEK